MGGINKFIRNNPPEGDRRAGARVNSGTCRTPGLVELIGETELKLQSSFIAQRKFKNVTTRTGTVDLHMDHTQIFLHLLS